MKKKKERIVYISHKGDDETGNGTEQSPFMTMARAHEEMMLKGFDSIVIKAIDLIWVDEDTPITVPPNCTIIGGDYGDRIKIRMNTTAARLEEAWENLIEAFWNERRRLVIGALIGIALSCFLHLLGLI